MSVAFDPLKPASRPVATVADLRESELRLHGEIRESESRLRREIRESESRLQGELASVRTEVVKWVIIGAIGFQTVVILGAVAALIRLLR
jgi:hypothetical protein